MRLLREKIAENPGVSPGFRNAISAWLRKAHGLQNRSPCRWQKRSPRSGPSLCGRRLGWDCLAGADLGLPCSL